ncbi:hypothetical protein HBI70_125990 [Parastagonospora nodorum]|nr:hypothetical protein HBI70_125990 [Parastagonospora nodorum]
MLWCKLLGPLASLLGCSTAPSASPGSVISLEKLMVITEIAQLVAPPPTTVTVTVGIPATSIGPVTAASPTFPLASPVARPFSIEWDNTLESPLSTVAHPWSNGIFAVADWLENSGVFVTPLVMVKAIFVLMCLHLLYMMAFKSFGLPFAWVKLVIRGAYMSSKIAWAFLFGAGLYLVYDTLPADPVCLVVMNLLHCHNLCSHTYLHVCENVMLWLSDLSPGKRNSSRQLRWHQLHDATDQLMREDKWAPKTLVELLVGMLVGLFRSTRAVSNLCVSICLSVWTWSIPPAVTLARGLTAWVDRVLRAMIGSMIGFLLRQMMKRGYTWRSPFTWLLVTRPREIWAYFKNIRAFIVLFVWMRVLDTPWKTDLNLATSWEQHDAMVRLTSMHAWDMVKVILAYAQLQREFEKLRDTIRAEYNGKVEGTIKTLAERTISFQSSLTAMAYDYNHTRRTLDTFASVMLCIMLQIDPQGPQARQFFVSGHIMTTLAPLANGLHYAVRRSVEPLGLHLKAGIAHDVRKVMGFTKLNIKMRHQFVGYIPTMDLFKPDTHGFDLREMGFFLAPFNSRLDDKFGHSVSDTRTATPGDYKYRELEDYCLAGRVVEWHEDAGWRQQHQAQLAHPWFAGGASYGTSTSAWEEQQSLLGCEWGIALYTGGERSCFSYILASRYQRL